MNQPSPTPNSPPQSPAPKQAFLKVEMQTDGLEKFFAKTKPGDTVQVMHKGKVLREFQMPERPVKK